MRTQTRIGLALTAASALLMLFAGAAAAGLTPDDDTVEFTPDTGGEDSEVNVECNGLIPPGNHTNTEKTIIGGDLSPGGEVHYRLSYPIDPDSNKKQETWVVRDCVLISLDEDGNLLSGDDLDLDKSSLSNWQELVKGEFTGVPNADAEFFTFSYVVDIPADVPLGTRICNVARTTAAPSAQPGSNRKAGLCFTVAGGARVEKHAEGVASDGATLDGATFEISDCENTAVDPDEQPLVVTPAPAGGGPEGTVVAEDGFITFSGASGSSCVVTETIPPEGYGLPADPEDRSTTVVLDTDEVAHYDFFDPEESQVLPTASSSLETDECEPTDGDSLTVVDVSLIGDAALVIEDADGNTVETFSDDGSVTVGPGEYTWTVTPGEGVTLVGDDSGSFTAEECEPNDPGANVRDEGADDQVEVLGERLAATGTVPLPALYGGIGFLTMGMLMLAASKRRTRALERLILLDDWWVRYSPR